MLTTPYSRFGNFFGRPPSNLYILYEKQITNYRIFMNFLPLIKKVRDKVFKYNTKEEYNV